MPSFPSPDITLGIEIEFMSPCASSNTEWGKKDPGSAARLHIAELMAKKTNLPIACLCTHEPEDYCPICQRAPSEKMDGFIRVLSSGEIIRPKGTETAQNYYLFETEYLDGLALINKKRAWHAIEMNTPILKHGELVAGLSSMKEVLSALRNMNTEITADESCGLHVHVGAESGMTLLLAKKVISLVFLLEESLLLALCSPWRLASQHAAPIVSKSRVALGIPLDDMPATKGPNNVELMEAYIPSEAMKEKAGWNDKNPKALYDMLEMVWSTTSLQQLNLIISRQAFTRAGLYISLRDEKGEVKTPKFAGNLENSSSTIEFRYAQMSFDIVFVRNWAELVCRIVQLAQLDAEQYQDAFREIGKVLDEAKRRKEPAWEKLLKTLQLENRIGEWGAQIQRYKMNEHISFLDDQLLLKPEH
ncbi:hypothetical protein G7046_g8429 [Stylonectria norvegica]|nr:hypothetical protein G7046_g8429 [Stylonectria norvegica]